ncbi:hypothetical protein LPJ70_003130 [Coemansia sp. RSA 2708]|nr:hypothetical protein LPJ70_003130 [Coemansia sp. RSA 2708]
MHKNGHLATSGPAAAQQPPPHLQGRGDARSNKVESLLQSQAPGEPGGAAPARKDHLHSNSPLYIHDATQQQQQQQPKAEPGSQPGSQQPSVPASPYGPRPAGGEAGGADAGPASQSGRAANHAPPQLSPTQGPYRRARQHAATISEPMGPQPGAQRPSRMLMSPPQGSFRYHQPHTYGPAQPQRTATGPGYDGRGPGYDARGPGYDARGPAHMTSSPQDARPRRLSFIGTALAGDAHREQYETSFSRSTSTAGAYPASAQASPHGAHFAAFPGRQAYAQLPPASAPAHQQHFSPHGPYAARPAFGSLPAPGVAGQRSLSPPPARRAHLPVPGRFDSQRSPLPFPRISSPSMQQQQQAPEPGGTLAALTSPAAGTTSQSPARESTRRLSSVVWGPNGFERLESGMSRCRICGKEYSKGSSTGTLKRHFRQHAINTVAPALQRPSPPAPAHPGMRPRAYSHRAETRREGSPFAPARMRAPPAPEPKPEPTRRTDSLGDIDSSSVIAGSALLSMAAGDADAMRMRPARSSDPSVYPQTLGPPEDPDTRDISVSPSPSSSSLDARRDSRGAASDAMDVDDAAAHRHKRRRATVAGEPTELSRELDSLSATQLVALSSELVRRVASALPALALEAGAAAGADPLEALFRHVRGAMRDQGLPANGQPPDAFSLPLSFSAPPHEPLPFTIRKQVPLPASASISVESLSLSEMTLLSRVSAAMQRIAPLCLAQRKWDNVGILLEAATPRASASKVFLTIDLTPEVLDEALGDPAVGVIVAYHPPIFFAWKALTMSDLKQSLVLKCAAAGVSIYSPHTALDSCAGGINDWLASLLGAGAVRPITPVAPENADGQENAGDGRIVELAAPLPFSGVVAAVKQQLGLERVRVARATRHGSDEQLVSTVAICAGSGASTVAPCKADVYFTGEMDHHSMLAAVAQGTSCIVAEHSNTERGYLRAVLAQRLQQELDADKVDEATAVAISERDHDPITIV